ncbi:MAG: hypothetical protein HY744_01665 [Deltaproteobacteria bacterium]|nr:hypothetical protein [Deltaproteobacteria bacterium]
MSAQREATGSEAGAAGGRAPSAQRGNGDEVDVLARLLRWAACLGLVAALLDRGVAPALAGVGVGLGTAIAWVERLASLLSQLLAVVLVLATIRLTLPLWRSPLPASWRIFAVAVGGVVVMGAMTASAVPVPLGTALACAGGAVGLALWTGGSALRWPGLRGPALVLVAVAAAGVPRLAAVALAYHAGELGSARLFVGARAAATAAVLLDVAACVVGMAWLGSRPGRRPRLVPGVALIVAAGLLARLSFAGSEPGAPGVLILLGRVLDRLVSFPAPVLPDPARFFAEALAWLVAAAVLAGKRRRPLGATVVALALLARGAVEMPLCAAALVLAALGLSARAATLAGGGRAQT